MRKNNKKGLFVGLEQGLLRSDAFWLLSAKSQMAIVWLELIYWEGERKNPMEISQAILGQWCRCSTKTAQAILTELDDYGFLVRERAGTLKGPHTSRTAIYRMTWLNNNSGQSPTNDFKQYKSQTG